MPTTDQTEHLTVLSMKIPTELGGLQTWSPAVGGGDGAEEPSSPVEGAVEGGASREAPVPPRLSSWSNPSK